MIWDYNNESFFEFMKDTIEFDHPRKFFIRGSDKDSVFAQSPFRNNVLILRINYSE